MSAHENYEFRIIYEHKTGEITTKVKMPANILAKGLAYSLANIDIPIESLEIYLEEIKQNIKKIRNENGTT